MGQRETEHFLPGQATSFNLSFAWRLPPPPPTLCVCDPVPSRVFWMGSRPSRATNLSQIYISLLCSTQSIMSHCCLLLDSGLNCISSLCTELFHHPSPLKGTSPGWLAGKAVFWWNTQSILVKWGPRIPTHRRAYVS